MRLEVPLYKNFNSNSCFVAVIAMILRHFGTTINQRKMYEKAKVYNPKNKKEIWGCTVPSVIFAIKDKGYKMVVWQDKDSEQIKKDGKETEMFFDVWEEQIKKGKKMGIIELHQHGAFSLIKKYLNKGLPVIVGLRAKTFYKGNKYYERSFYNKPKNADVNHVIVVTGYENGHYIYNDSSPFLPGKIGKDLSVSEDRLINAWKDATHIKNALFVLQKI